MRNPMQEVLGELGATSKCSRTCRRMRTPVWGGRGMTPVVLAVQLPRRLLQLDQPRLAITQTAGQTKLVCAPSSSFCLLLFQHPQVI